MFSELRQLIAKIEDKNQELKTRLESLRIKQEKRVEAMGLGSLPMR